MNKPWPSIEIFKVAGDRKLTRLTVFPFVKFLFVILGMSVTTQSGSGRQWVSSGRQYVTGS